MVVFLWLTIVMTIMGGYPEMSARVTPALRKFSQTHLAEFGKPVCPFRTTKWLTPQ